MALDITKEYLTKKECDILIGRANLSRSESVSIPRHLASIFEQAEYKGRQHGAFTYNAGKTNIAVEYTRQSGGAKSILLKRESLNALVPALASAQPLEATAASKPIPTEAPSHHTPHWKPKNELGPEWKTYHDLPALVEKEAKNAGKRMVLKGAISRSMAYIGEAFQGEVGTAYDIRCHKYAGSHGTSVAIHEDDMPKYFALLQKISRSLYRTNHPEKQNAGVAR